MAELTTKNGVTIHEPATYEQATGQCSRHDSASGDSDSKSLADEINAVWKEVYRCDDDATDITSIKNRVRLLGEDVKCGRENFRVTNAAYITADKELRTLRSAVPSEGRALPSDGPGLLATKADMDAVASSTEEDAPSEAAIVAALDVLGCMNDEQCENDHDYRSCGDCLGMTVRALKAARSVASSTERVADDPDLNKLIYGKDANIWLGKLYDAAKAWKARAEKAESALSATTRGPLKLDTDSQVFFYEQDHYYLSNFSAFKVWFEGHHFDTSEQAYHFLRFPEPHGKHRHAILFAESAHDAFRYAQDHKSEQRADWDAIKLDVMRNVLRAKATQHEYVRRKLLQTGDRELVENSWRDPYWGWGPNRDGLNMLGKLWMEVRAELRAASPSPEEKR
jgi:ribA/ribD-fused uncharacterized protein